jgi:hypothetical protein
MKYIRIFLCAVLCGCLCAIDAQTISKNTIDYQSPLNNAHYVKPQSSIILRSAFALPRSGPSPARFIRIVGSLSGPHAVRGLISDDQRTMIFLPDSPFLPSEKVTVQWMHGMPTAANDTLPSRLFHFTISSAAGKIVSRLQKQGLRAFEGSEFTARNGTGGAPMPKRAAAASVDTVISAGLPEIKGLYSNNPTQGGIFISDIPVGDTAVLPYLLVISNNGSIVFQRQMSAECTDFRPEPNGNYTYYDAGSFSFCEIDPTVSNVQNTYVCADGYETDPHDIQFLPNGHVLLLGQDYEFVDMSGLVAGGSANAEVIGAVVQELDRAGNAVFEWRSWDHFNITDATHEDLTQPVIDYVHANALQLDADGNILLSSRHMDEITKIDRGTGGIIWRLGGKHNQFTFLNDTIGFSHQHDIRRIANGHVTLFDNGNFHSPQISRACEYRLDEVNRTATLVWQYQNPLNTYSNSMGSVQRLENGNTLIGWGSTSSPAVTEVTPAGVKAFEMSLPDNVVSYRAYRYALPTFASGNPSNPDIPDAYALEQNYPNPFNPSTTIEYTIPEPENVVLRVYDVLGRVVATLVNQPQPAGRYRMLFAASGLASGVYYCRLETAHFSQVLKMLLMK